MVRFEFDQIAPMVAICFNLGALKTHPTIFTKNTTEHAIKIDVET
jgi:hypothetical protein